MTSLHSNLSWVMAAMNDIEYTCFLTRPLFLDNYSVLKPWGPNYYMSLCCDLSISVEPLMGSTKDDQSINKYMVVSGSVHSYLCWRCLWVTWLLRQSAAPWPSLLILLPCLILKEHQSHPYSFVSQLLLTTFPFHQSEEWDQMKYDLVDVPLMCLPLRREHLPSWVSLACQSSWSVTVL
jgi:hypothetical protein